MKAKAIVPLVLGLGIGLIAVKVGFDAIKKARGSVQQQTMVHVVVASQDIGAYQEITAEMVTLVETPETALVSKTERIESLEDIVGRVVKKSIPQSVPVLTTMLADVGTPAGLHGRIPPGFRAVSVKIDEVTGVAYQISPGDWVDVNVVIDIESEQRIGRKRTISGILFRAVQVAAIGRDVQSQAGGNAPAAKPAKSATLLIRQNEVPDLHLASTRGRITLALCPVDEVGTATKGLMQESSVYAALTNKSEEKPADQVPKANLLVSRTEPKVSSPRSTAVSVIVNHGSNHKTWRKSVERITYATPTSANIIEVKQGASDDRAATFKANATAGLDVSRTNVANQADTTLPTRKAAGESTDD